MTAGRARAERSRRVRSKRTQRQLQSHLVERLEDRRLLAVASFPNQPLTAIPNLIAIESGLIDNNASTDLVAINSQGQLAVALNGGDNNWQSLRTLELNLGTSYGLAAGLINADASLDLVAVGDRSARILLGDRSGGFTLGPELVAPVGASWRPTDNGLAGVAIGHLNDDLFPDIVLLDTAGNRAFVWWGGSDGSFTGGEAIQQAFPSGANDPISVAIGNVVGDMHPDIVVGHRDGTISLLAGLGADKFSIAPASAQLHRAQSIRTLKIADIDHDGDQDIAVGATTEAFVLLRDAHPLASPPIVNGDFTRGLTGWTIESVGQRAGQSPGEVNALSGAARLDERSSFLTSLSQSFIVPSTPQTITLDVDALDLEYADGTIPDAFELSLLDSAGRSLVPVHRSGATSFFNAVGQASGTPAIRLAAGVTFAGRTVTLDISRLVSGTQATLYIDLVGNPPGDGASATVDNVTVSPSHIFSHSFALQQLPGALVLASGISVGDVDGDGNTDVIVSDREADQVVVFNRATDGAFARSVLSTTVLGTGPSGVALARLSSDNVLDIAYTLADSATIVTPLGTDTTPPQAALISPTPGAVLSQGPSELVIQFSEPVLDTGSLGKHSVTNINAYRVYELGANGIDDAGGGDDRLLAIGGVSYDSSTKKAKVQIASSNLPLPEGRYRIRIRGADVDYSIRDILNNPLAGGSDVVAGFSVDRPPVLGALSVTTGALREGQDVTVKADFTDGVLGGPYAASVQWGDGTTSPINSVASPGSLTATHVYPDNGSYLISLTLVDVYGNKSIKQKTISVANVPPSLAAGSNLSMFAGDTFQGTLATFIDPGFNSAVGSSRESFEARVNWGDGSPITTASLEVRSGAAGIATTGSVRAEHRYSNPGVYTVTISLTDDDGGTATTSLTANVLQASAGRCLPAIDFETNALGEPLSSESSVASAFAAWGVHISTASTAKVEPRVVNWRDSFQSKTIGGAEQGNVLIVTSTVNSGQSHGGGPDEDDDHCDEWDGRDGHEHNHDPADASKAKKLISTSGTLIFSFDAPVMLDEIDLLGITGTDKASVRVYSPSGTLIKSLNIAGDARGTQRIVSLAARNVARLEVTFSGAGGISKLIFCGDSCEGDRVTIASKNTRINEGQSVALQMSSPGVTATQWLVNWGDGSIETLLGNSPTTSHKFTDGPAARSIYATARDAVGNIYLANRLAVQVANVAPTLTISGAGDIEAGVPYTLKLSAVDPGADALSGWTVNWGDGVVETLAGNASTAQHIFRPKYAKDTRFNIQATARDEDNAGSAEYRSNTLAITVRPDTSLQLPTIDFERSSSGAKLREGDRITDQFASLGVRVTTLAPATQWATILDSASKAQASRDVASPNSSFGGPGQGKGGERGQAGENRKPLENVLVISRTVPKTTSPDDDETGGTLVFTFDRPVRLDEIHLLDIDRDGSSIRLFSSNGSLISSVPIPNRGRNSFQIVALNASHVSRMEIVLSGGGAVASVISNRENAPIAIPETRFFVVDTSDKAFRYSAPGADIGDWPLATAINALGIATTRDANPVWIVSEEGSEDRIYVYDTSRETLLGSWSALGVVAPQGIATDGKDIWIVDGSTRRVVRYAGAATRRSGSIAPTDSFALAKDNRQPTDLVTDGSSIWVVDSASDQVYVYNRAGSLRNQWKLDPANADPTGITINPRSSDGIFILDAVDKRVYSYPLRTLSKNGSQAARESFALSSGNAQPTGLADPGGQVAIGDVVVGSITVPGQTVDWTFSATAGQRIYIDFQDLSDWMQSDLIAPGGQLLYTKNFFRSSGLDSGSLTLPKSGTYTLRLTSASAPSYRFQIFDIPAPDTHAVVLGQVHSGALDSPGRADQWTFTAVSGTRMFLDFLSLDTVVGGDLVVDVVAPSGSIISTRTATRADTLDQGFALSETGSYTILMHAAFDGSQLPAYSFQLWQVPADDVGSLAFRQPTSGRIEVAGARDRWQFQAQAGQNVFLDFSKITGGDLRVQVVQPDGTTLASRTFSLPAGLDQELVLPQAGTYTVLIDGAGTANLNTYEFTLWDIPPELLERTTLNTTLSGYAVPGETVPFEFEAMAGTPILLDIIDSADQSLGVSIIRPDGQTLVARATKDTLTTLAQTGMYRVIVARASETVLDGHGNYSFRIQDASSPALGMPDNLGTRFHLAFPANLREPFVTYDPSFSLSITSAVDTSGTVQVPGIGFYAAYEVKAGVTTVVTLPDTVELSESDKVLDRGILVTALHEVAVYGLDQFTLLSEGFTALPSDALGKDYYVLGYANTVTYVVGGGTNLTLAATSNNTQVTITPAVAVGVHPAGVPFTITLSEGQAYTLHTSLPLMADLSGSRVTATQPIALFGGNTAARVPEGYTAANHLIEQLPPVTAWGRRFITEPLATRTGGDTFRIMAQKDQTEVRINGILVRTLSAGQFDQRTLASGSVIEGSAPLLVAQYSNSSAFDNAPADPFMMLVPPLEQYLSDYTLSTPASGFDRNFANLIVPTSAVSSVQLDGQLVPASSFVPIGSSGYSGAQVAISVGSHHFHASQPFAVSVYGYAPFDAYGYFGGMSMGSIATVNSLELTPRTVGLPVNTLHTLTATVRDSSGAPIPGVRVDFTVTGSSLLLLSAFTDRDGRASISYTRTAIGTDTIAASIASQSQTATVNWTTASPTVTVTNPSPSAELATGKQLITGIASPGSPGTAIIEVTVNGRRVDAVDAGGNFFAVVDVSSGSQTFRFTATDSLGLQASTTLEVVGKNESSSPFDALNSNDITASTSVEFSGTTFNRNTRRLQADMRIINRGSEPLDPTIAVQLDRITPNRVRVRTPDAVAANGQPQMLFDSELPSDGLNSGQQSAPSLVTFDNSELDRFAIELKILAEGNRSPRFVSSPQLQIAAGANYRYQSIAIDPDSSRIIYSLSSAPEGMQINAQSGMLTWSVPANAGGSHQIVVNASDGRGAAASQSFTLAVATSLPNRPPVFQSAPGTAVLPNQNYRYAAQASDPDGDRLTFALTAGPNGMTIDSNSGLISYNRAVSGVYSVALTVSDSRGGVATQRYVLQVGQSSGISSPTIVSAPPVVAVAGTQYLYAVTAVDPMQTELTFQLLERPAGMAIDSRSGRITWTPASEQVGTEHSVRVEVRNALGGIGSQAYRVSVLTVRPGAAPVFRSRPLEITTMGEVYRYTALASDPEGQPIAYALATAPAGMSINAGTGELTWQSSASARGTRRVLITATDSDGLVAYQQFSLSVRDVNTAPSFVSSPVLASTVGNAYRYSARAIDTEDEVTYRLIDAPTDMLIDPRSGAITWQPRLADVGSHPITVAATDARGLTAQQAFTLVVARDSEAPLIDIWLSQESAGIGQTVKVRVTASDNVAVTSLTLSANGRPLSLNASGEATFKATSSGFQRFTATASDASGNTASAWALLRVRDSSDTSPPTVVIVSPSNRTTVTYLTDIVGTVADANLETYSLEYSRLNMADWRMLATRSVLDGGPIDILSGRIGTFDPTLLMNDQYEIRLTATDINGLTASTSIVLDLEGNAKIGVLQVPSAEACRDCSAADVSIPVAGGPAIAVTRQYSTLTAEESGDFGPGWQFCMAQPNIRETRARSEFEDIVGQFAALPLHDGDKVYITTPSCERVGFTFSPTLHTGIWSEVGSSFYDPRWIPDPGVDWQLYGESDYTRLTGIASGEFDLNGLPLPLVRYQDNQYILAALSTSYNPLGYQLIAKDGTRYHYSQTDGLLDVNDRHGNRLTMTDDGITSSSGQGVRFQRDSQGRITKISDDQGRETKYLYNTDGQLAKVEYPSGLSNTYRYTADHLLAAINEDNAQQEMLTRSFQYDMAGRLAATLDAFGYSNTQTYDLATRTQTTRDALGNATTYQYDTRGNIVFERSPAGATVTMEYDANDKRTRIIDEMGFATSFSYDAHGNTTSVIDALGNRTLFAYDDANNVVYQRDARGGEYFYQYALDAGGRGQDLVRVIQPGGGDWRMTYDSVGRLLSSTDVDGRVRRYEYGNQSMPTRIIDRDGSSVQIEYNAYGHMRTYVDELGRRTTYAYDAQERPTSITDPLGNVTRLSYQGRAIERVIDASGSATRYVLDAELRPLQIIHPDGGVTLLEYDPNGRRTAMVDPNGHRTRYTYRSDGRLASMIDAQGGTTSYEYDPVGRQISITNPNGHRWQTEYDALGYATATIDPLGNRTTRAFDAFGNLTSQTDALGRTTSFEYNNAQRPTRVVDALGGQTLLSYAWDGRLLSEQDPLGHRRTYTYDAQNRLISQTDAAGGSQRFSYDAAGNQIAWTDELGNQTHVDYDALNRPVAFTDASGAISRLAYDPLGRVLKVIDAAGGTTSIEYDAVGRPTKTIDPLGGSERVAYDLAGNVVSAIDALGRETTFTYDALNQRVSKSDALGQITQSTYDAAGNLKTLRDPLGNVTTFTYDALERFIGSSDPLGAQSSLAYDAVGNIAKTVDRNGRTTLFTYDALNHLASEQWLTSNGGVVNQATYSYDAAGNLVAAADAKSRYAMTYDTLNRLTTIDNAGTSGAPRVKFTSTYDASGNRLSLSDNAGVTVASTYDARNMLASLVWSGGGVAPAHVDFTYDPRGLVSKITRFASLNSSNEIGSSAFRYDAKGRLEELRHVDATGKALTSYTYARDLADQLVSETHHGHTRQFIRDALGQLTRTLVDGAQAESFAYDAHGNRVSSGEVIGADNRLLENATNRFEYDREGNLVRSVDKATGETWEYSYDHRQRLVSGIRRSAAGVLLTSVSNAYDVFNRRIARTVDVDGAGAQPATTVFTSYDGQNAWADYDAKGNPIARYLFGAATDEIIARWRPGAGTAWYLTDHAGTVRDILNAAGKVVDTLEYDSFGRIVSQTNATLGDRFTYTGREWDAELKLYYYRARFYDPATGRFISQDPLGFGAGDSNLYRYVGNSPVDHTDPSGMLALTECAFVRAIHTAVNVVCPVLQMSLDGSLASQDIDQQVENAFQMMNTAFSVLPFGSSLALQTTLRAITTVQTAQALASLDVNQHLFSMLELAETYVVEAYEIYQRGAAETFQQALHAFAQSDNKQLLLTRMLCGAANMGLMVLSAQARCFVAGTPVVVGLLPPDDGAQEQLADAWGITLLDVLAGVAIAGAVVARRRQRREEQTIMNHQASDDFFGELGREAEAELEPQAAERTVESPAAGQFVCDSMMMHSLNEDSDGDERPPASTAARCLAEPVARRSAKTKTWLATFGCLLLALVCAAPRLLSTSASATAAAAISLKTDRTSTVSSSASAKLITKPIEEIRCGERVVAELPAGVAAVDEPEPDTATWRLVEVELRGDDGERIEVHLLRPATWLEQVGALPDGEFPLQAEELGVDGTGVLLRVQPCPIIASGAGQVVTGTFRHTSGSLVELQLEGIAEPIVCTSGHPIWSEAQQRFVSASSLVSGDSVRLASGAHTRIHAQHPHPGTASVFNLEINRHHVYHVGPNGLLVHNSGLGSCEDLKEQSGREQPRNALGQFMPWSSTTTATPGSLAVDDFIIQAQNNGWEVLGREISVKTPFGRRRYDAVIRDPATGRNTAVELKSSRSAFERRMREQFAGDHWLREQGGLQGLGKAKDIFVNDVIKILWEIP